MAKVEPASANRSGACCAELTPSEVLVLKKSLNDTTRGKRGILSGNLYVSNGNPVSGRQRQASGAGHPPRVRRDVAVRLWRFFCLRPMRGRFSLR